MEESNLSSKHIQGSWLWSSSQIISGLGSLHPYLPHLFLRDMHDVVLGSPWESPKSQLSQLRIVELFLRCWQRSEILSAHWLHSWSRSWLPSMLAGLGILSSHVWVPSWNQGGGVGWISGCFGSFRSSKVFSSGCANFIDHRPSSNVLFQSTGRAV